MWLCPPVGRYYQYLANSLKLKTTALECIDDQALEAKRFKPKKVEVKRRDWKSKQFNLRVLSHSRLTLSQGPPPRSSSLNSRQGHCKQLSHCQRLCIPGGPMDNSFKDVWDPRSWPRKGPSILRLKHPKNLKPVFDLCLRWMQNALFLRAISYDPMSIYPAPALHWRGPTCFGGDSWSLVVHWQTWKITHGKWRHGSSRPTKSQTQLSCFHMAQCSWTNPPNHSSALTAVSCLVFIWELFCLRVNELQAMCSLQDRASQLPFPPSINNYLWTSIQSSVIPARCEFSKLELTIWLSSHWSGSNQKLRPTPEARTHRCRNWFVLHSPHRIRRKLPGHPTSQVYKWEINNQLDV